MNFSFDVSKLFAKNTNNRAMADAADESSGDRHSGSTTEDVGIRLVVQRCNSAELLVDNVDQWVGIGWGLVCSISFAPAADVAKVVICLSYVNLLSYFCTVSLITAPE